MSNKPWILLLTLPLFVAPAFGGAPEGTPPSLTIAAEARCVESAGIAIEEVPDNQVKLACLKDRTVREQCNPDGHRARLQAYRDWTHQLVDFKERCSSVGGVFAYADPSFQEPINASFCSAAQPEVSYNSFETPLCNFISRCPQVAVNCLSQEDSLPKAPSTVFLPGVPQAVSLTY